MTLRRVVLTALACLLFVVVELLLFYYVLSLPRQ